MRFESFQNQGSSTNCPASHFPVASLLDFKTRGRQENRGLEDEERES